MIDRIGVTARPATCCPTKRVGCIALINRIDNPAGVIGIQLPVSKGQGTVSSFRFG
jgi:hypothetical protein